MDSFINGWLNLGMDGWMEGWINDYGYGYCNGYVSSLQLLFVLVKQAILKVQQHLDWQ